MLQQQKTKKQYKWHLQQVENNNVIATSMENSVLDIHYNWDTACLGYVCISEWIQIMCIILLEIVFSVTTSRKAHKHERFMKKGKVCFILNLWTT